MNRSSFALFVALLIHLLLLLLFWILGTMAPEFKNPPKQKENKIKVSLRELPKHIIKKRKTTGNLNKKPKPTPIAPPMPKGSQLKKIVKKPPIKFKPKKPPKKPKLNEVKPPKPKPKKQPKIEPLIPKKYTPFKQEITKQDDNITKKIKPKKKKKTLYDILAQDKSDEIKTQKQTNSKLSKGITQDIKELYGAEFGKMTPGQQKYILDNQEIMRRITQQVLNRVARVNLKGNIHVNTENVIEFYLHPNGDISDLRLIKKSGYYELDDITKETIEYAYGKYPRPSEKTLIRYNVFYNLAY